MKKILAMLLALMLCVSMIACSNDGDKKDDDQEESTVATTTKEADETTTAAPAATTEAPEVTEEPDAVVFADYEDAVDALVEAMDSGDVDLYYNVLMDPYLVANMVEDVDEFKEDTLAYDLVGVDGYDISYAILDAYNAEDEVFDSCVSLLGMYEYPEDAIDEIVFVELALTVENDEEEETEEDIFVTVRIDGNWYVSMILTSLLAPADEEYTDEEYTNEEYTYEDVYFDGEYYYVGGFILDEEGTVVGEYEEDENGDIVVKTEE